MQIQVNGETTKVDVDPQMPLLWVLREELGLVGTRYSCGIGACGACTVHVSGVPTRACVLPVGEVTGPVTTIEGLTSGDELHPVQQAWIAEQVAQCGYCQSGQIMTAVALLERDPSPSEAAVAEAFRGNLCRCGTYPRIIRAVRSAAEQRLLKLAAELAHDAG